MLVRPEGKGILRVFDPLQYPTCVWSPDCIMNLTVFLENNALRRDKDGFVVRTNNDRELYHVKKNIEVFDKLSPSTMDDFSMELLVTVNGNLTDERAINYLKSIDDKHISNNRIHIKVWQRPNIGWQWGSLWDIWQRWKGLNTTWWISKECDWHFQVENWYDVLREKFYEAEESGNRICFVSGHERKFDMDPYEYYGPLDKVVWRDKHNKPLERVSIEDIRHVQPSYYFITKGFLDDMDKSFGCFTAALGKSYELDAICHGEIGFCQKAKVLGY